MDISIEVKKLKKYYKDMFEDAHDRNDNPIIDYSCGALQAIDTMSRLIKKSEETNDN